jgi:hypothetical protein
VVAALARDVAARHEDACDTDPFGHMLERVPAVVLGIAARIEIVPEREEGGAFQIHRGLD